MLRSAATVRQKSQTGDLRQDLWQAGQCREGSHRYKRLVGKVYLGDRYIKAEMVADGAAWEYLKYSKNPQLLELERQAREEGRGLWALQENRGWR